MTERETLELLQIDILRNIILNNMDKMTPTPPGSGRMVLYSHFT